MSPLATYRFGIVAGLVVEVAGAALGQVWAIVAGGVLAVCSARWALLERRRLAETEQLLHEMAAKLQQLPASRGHVRLLRKGDDPASCHPRRLR